METHKFFHGTGEKYDVLYFDVSSYMYSYYWDILYKVTMEYLKNL